MHIYFLHRSSLIYKCILQKPCNFNKLSCIYCNVHIMLCRCAPLIFSHWPPFNLFLLRSCAPTCLFMTVARNFYQCCIISWELILLFLDPVGVGGEHDPRPTIISMRLIFLENFTPPPHTKFFSNLMFFWHLRFQDFPNQKKLSVRAGAGWGKVQFHISFAF